MKTCNTRGRLEEVFGIHELNRLSKVLDIGDKFTLTRKRNLKCNGDVYEAYIFGDTPITPNDVLVVTRAYLATSPEFQRREEFNYIMYEAVGIPGTDLPFKFTTHPGVDRYFENITRKEGEDNK